jgi:hypothetical protein
MGVPAFHRYLTAEQIEDFEERAAIMEFCGGLPRDEAERLARQGVLEKATSGFRENSALTPP